MEGEREEPHEETSPNHFPSPLKLGGGASDTQHRHLHAMVSLLRPEDTIKLVRPIRCHMSTDRISIQWIGPALCDGLNLGHL